MKELAPIKLAYGHVCGSISLNADLYKRRLVGSTIPIQMDLSCIKQKAEYESEKSVSSVPCVLPFNSHPHDPARAFLRDRPQPKI